MRKFESSEKMKLSENSYIIIIERKKNKEKFIEEDQNLKTKESSKGIKNIENESAKHNHSKIIAINYYDLVTAHRTLPKSAFAFYLFLASKEGDIKPYLNEDSYRSETGYSRATYYRASDELKDKHYLYMGLRGYEFATAPTDDIIQNWE